MCELAINGGTPVRTKEWAAWPSFSKDEIEAVSNVLASGKVNYWTGEPKIIQNTNVRGNCGEFEFRFSKFLGSKYSICTANGTLALELCLQALDIGCGDEVIVPNRTFIATASACIARGAIPVFADVDLESQNINLNSIKEVTTTKTKGIICVHLAGWPCEMSEIIEFAKANNIKVIEDCAQSIGAKYHDKMLGTFGDMAAFSFCQDKIITTGGEGGMITTNDPELYKRAWEYKDHGKNFHKYNSALGHDLVEKKRANNLGYYSSIGTNWRMTEMQAAIGIKQLEKLPRWIETRRSFAKILDEGFSEISSLKVIIPPPHIHHAYYKYYAFLHLEKIKKEWTRESIIDAISAEGVVCQFGSTWGVGLEHGWKNVPIQGSKDLKLSLNEHLKNDKKIGSTVLMFQVHPTLDQESILDTVIAVKKVLLEASI